MEILKTDGVDIRSWCPNAEDDALQQMKLIASLPYVKEVCLMPDGHIGMDCCIGGVVATDNVVVPSFVGSDCGCGMCAIKTTLTVSDLNEEKSKQLFNQIKRDIPVGFAKSTKEQQELLAIQYKDRFNDLFMSTFGKNADALNKKYNPFYGKEISEEDLFFSQLMSLGNGNHFWECQADENDNIWAMIHSGSRNMGKVIGEFYNELASKMNSKWHSDNHGIPFLPVDSDEGKSYLTWMEFALGFAYCNRLAMMNKTIDILSDMFPDFELITNTVDGINDWLINIHHNYAALENHHGRNYWIHRKGSTNASLNTVCIIPGSMGSASYIGKGLGNHLSLNSCSHGAGRKMGRMEFSRLMKDSMDSIEESLKGVLHSKFGEVQYGKNKGMKDVSEAPGAYKNIEDVMSQQEDLVESIVKLRPLISVKG